MTNDHGSNEIAIALSGGGHRATLVTIGALLALVDRGLNAEVRQIASVSGGSITNAFVAQRCDFATVTPEQMADIAVDLVRRVNRGAVTAPWIAALLLGPTALACLVGWAAWSRAGPVLGVFAGTVALGAGMLATGRGVQRAVRRRFFADGPSGGSDPRVQDLEGADVEHVFCATDLVHGQPVYVSSHDGGVLWRRTRQVQLGDSFIGSVSVGQRWDCSELTVAEVVRASAAFPGIPPRRVSFGRRSRLSWIPTESAFGGRVPAAETPQEAHESLRAAPVAFLADGGLWNNLATQVLREDKFFRGDKSITTTRLPGVLMCVNGSAPVAPGRTWPYHLPGIGLFASLVRGSKILNVNTVVPRVQALRVAAYDRLARDPVLLRQGPTDLVVEAFEETGTVESNLRRLRDGDRRYHPAGHPPHSPVKANLRNLEWLVGPIVGPIGGSEAWKRLRDRTDGAVAAPTTLGSITGPLAIRLFVRGYMNTYLTTMILKGETSSVALERPIKALEDLCDRIGAR